MSVSTEFRKGIYWNLVSFVLVGIGGILLNLIIGRYYNSDVLGIFNQTFAVYILFSQLANLGLRFSTLHYTSSSRLNITEKLSALCSSLIIATVLSIIVATLLYLGSGLAGSFFDSKDVGHSVSYVAPGLIFFSLNKVLMATANGLGHIKFYAFSQSFRVILIALNVWIISLLSYEGTFLSLSLTIAEGILFVTIVTAFLITYGKPKIANTRVWIRKHFIFALKAFPSGILLDVNTRVDVIMLGYFLSDSKTGIYSFAALIGEGVSQLPVAVMVSITPKLTKLLESGKYVALQKIIRSIRNRIHVLMLVVAVIGCFIYPWFVEWSFHDAKMSEGVIPFMILLGGIVVFAGFSPFQVIFNQAGRPELYTYFMMAFVGVNVVLNALLIPKFELIGAAIATASAYIFAVLLFKIMVYRLIKIKV